MKTKFPQGHQAQRPRRREISLRIYKTVTVRFQGVALLGQYRSCKPGSETIKTLYLLELSQENMLAFHLHAYDTTRHSFFCSLILDMELNEFAGWS